MELDKKDPEAPQWFYDDFGDPLDLEEEAEERPVGCEFELRGAREVGTFRFRVVEEDGNRYARVIDITRSKNQPVYQFDADLRAANAEADRLAIANRGLRSLLRDLLAVTEQPAQRPGHACGPEAACDGDCVAFAHQCEVLERVKVALALALEEP